MMQVAQAQQALSPNRSVSRTNSGSHAKAFRGRGCGASARHLANQMDWGLGGQWSARRAEPLIEHGEVLVGVLLNSKGEEPYARVWSHQH
jgi:hypothetical protein